MNINASWYREALISVCIKIKIAFHELLHERLAMDPKQPISCVYT